MNQVDIAAIRPSLVVRVRSYYANNPEEELTYAGVTAKFGCTYETARKVVSALVAVGCLESVHVIRLRTKGVAKEVV